MNYRHAFHAGNHADVLKHATLARVLAYMLEKPKPFLFLDTHAGIARYDLDAEASTKTGEAEDGIKKLWDLDPAPPSLRPYLALVKRINREGLRWYPGSPAIARLLMRPEDRIELFELHPEDAQALKRATAGDKRVTVSRADGYHALKAVLPPPERRGVILIDPPFEAKDEAEQVLKGISQALRRFATGTYLLWYPIKDRPPVDRLHEGLKATGARRQLVAELWINKPLSPMLLNGSGLVVINPPFKLENWLKEALAAMADTFNAHDTKVAWLVPE
ncbi:MAG: 23S rRNA (adenine(2030)-N(6))-methyltransferase RlmJ [Alphaproteobacteria bacterium]|nr:23S rRNA (adenine(2030)-N(6))-methyltransferase RlmJ [Alphaproteobacteria bacterium]